MVELTYLRNRKSLGTHSGKSVVTIGRHPANDISLPDDTTISRFHAAIVENIYGDYFIRDLGSTFGITVNGTRCYRACLKPGDTAGLCKSSIEMKITRIGQGPVGDARVHARKVRIVKKGPLAEGSKTSAHRALAARRGTIGEGDLPPAIMSIFSLRTALLGIHDFGTLLRQFLRVLRDTSFKAEWGWVATAREGDLEVVHAIGERKGREFELPEALFHDVTVRGEICVSRMGGTDSAICLPVKDPDGVAAVVFLSGVAGDNLNENSLTALRDLIDDREVRGHVSSCRSSGRGRAELGAGAFRWKEKMVGNRMTPSMASVYDSIIAAGSGRLPCLILGETGTGKTYLAKTIHALSERREKPFVRIDLNTLSETVQASELFGTVKGAFTDAENRAGFFEHANGGTVFLDEVCGLSLDTQKRLLMVLEQDDPKITRLGSTKYIPIDVKVIAASNVEIEAMVVQGRFRQDLYRRLGSGHLTIRLPSLRKRREDIPLLANYFVDESGDQASEVEGMSRGAVSLLMAYDWPENIGELQQVVSQACAGVHNDGRSVILESDLSEKLMTYVASQSSRDAMSTGEMSLRLDDAERERIVQALKEAGGNKRRAAELLGISAPTLYSKMKKYGIGPGEV